MRIILVNKFHYMKGGSETYYFAVADALREMGHEVHYFAMEDEKNVPCEDADLLRPQPGLQRAELPCCEGFGCALHCLLERGEEAFPSAL